MEKKRNTGTLVPGKKYIWIPASLALLGLFGFIGNLSNLLPFRNFPGQIVAACFEAIITAIITVFLLKAQTNERTELELKRERFAVLFAKKSETYDAFLNNLVDIANRGSLTKAIELNPKNALAYSRRAAHFADIGIAVRANADLEEALRLAPNNDRLLGNCGIVYKTLGNRTQALEMYNRAIQINSKYPGFYYKYQYYQRYQFS